METAPSTFWPQGYPPNFNAHSRTRIVDIGEHKLPLPLQPSLQYPIDRFNAGENPLPMGLIPDPVNTAYAGLNATAMPGLTFSPLDGDAGSSWHSSIRDDDQRSSSTDSSASGRGFPTWGQGSPVMSSYRSNSIGMPFPDAAGSPCESTSYSYKSSEVIDPNLTLNFQSTDIYEPTIKFEFPFTNTIQNAEFDQDSFPLDTPYYTQPVLPNFHDGNTWAHRVPVTRSQSQNDGRTHSQSSSRSSNNGSSRSSKNLSRTPVSPISKRRAERRRSSSSSDDQPARSSNRPKTYKKKIPFHYCQEQGCKVDNVRFKNKSELKNRKHIETQHTKPYLCIFGFVGCSARFGARNEWKRHIATQHLFLYRYICDHQDCVEKNKAKTAFNRGDLFMKHLERMHAIPNLGDRKPGDPELIAWKKEMRETKHRCEQLRPPPQRMTCGFCPTTFEEGDKTWTELIDHVCLHYQNNDENMKRSNGYRDDPDLIAWMKDNKLFKNINDPMDVESESSSSRGNRKHSYASSSESSSARQIKQEQVDSF
ncbi:hypothetical protein TWF970_007265 [Orbilia oligospora]|uniref:C2H2-type domain-containing protein n=1 Tax=Orbilia oligospora TaxID=2813651 RepID=A0A7C8RF77_ORBOL|nr:hypothetical protein TWF970_007265 [Orbilia oligospora]